MKPRSRHGWIETVAPDQATGLLAKLYEAALDRAGKVFSILRIQSPRPQILRLSTQLYTEVMKSARSPLSRAQRELIATSVSALNGCGY